MESLIRIYDAYLSFEPWFQITFGIVGGLIVWFLTGIPFGIRSSINMRRHFHDDEKRATKLMAYVGSFMVMSFSGLIGTGYLIIRGFQKIKQRRKNKKTEEKS